jgi:hypothetical protein
MIKEIVCIGFSSSEYTNGGRERRRTCKSPMKKSCRREVLCATDWRPSSLSCQRRDGTTVIWWMGNAAAAGLQPFVHGIAQGHAPPTLFSAEPCSSREAPQRRSSILCCRSPPLATMHDKGGWGWRKPSQWATTREPWIKTGGGEGLMAPKGHGGLGKSDERGLGRSDGIGLGSGG